MSKCWQQDNANGYTLAAWTTVRAELSVFNKGRERRAVHLGDRLNVIKSRHALCSCARALTGVGARGRTQLRILRGICYNRELIPDAHILVAQLDRAAVS